MPSFWLPKQHYSSNHRGFKLLDSPRDQALWRKIRRALSPPEPPPHPAHTSRSYPVSSTWGRIFCAVSFLPVHSSRLHFPGVAEPVRWRSSPGTVGGFSLGRRRPLSFFVLTHSALAGLRKMNDLEDSPVIGTVWNRLQNKQGSKASCTS